MQKVQQLVHESSLTVTKGPTLQSKYHIDNGLLKYKARVVLSPTSSWRHKVITEHHTTSTAGHEGAHNTYHRIKRGFYWVRMKSDIKKFVSECHICQQNKYETISTESFATLPVPQTIWQDISIDFISGLPLCKGKSVVMVAVDKLVVDKLSKYAHFIGLAHPYTAAIVAQLFMDHVFKLHGMPASIISDRDPIFLSSFWKEFFKLHGSRLCLSSGYHPQTDGQTEIVNKCLETDLCCFTSAQPRKWLQWLS